MNLTPETKLSKALDLHPDVLDYVINLNPHDFERLRTPLMRQLMPKRITLARLAIMVDQPVETLIKGIYAAAHLTAPATIVIAEQTAVLSQNAVQAPEWTAQKVKAVVDLLAADERLDTDPFVPLFPALKQVGVGEVVLLKHKWEPQPLYDVWQKLGIEFYSVQQGPDEWWVYLRKGQASFSRS